MYRMSSSDDDNAIVAQTTIVKKEKKPRTEAQRQATAKALEALAIARQQKREAQKAKSATPMTQSALHKPKPKKVVEEYQEEEQTLPPPPPAKRMITIPESTPVDNMKSVMDELSNLRNELKTLRTPEPKAKPRKPRAKVVIEEESEEEEEPVVIRRKKKNTNGSRVHTPMEQQYQVQPRETDTNALLQSIFFRNY